MDQATHGALWSLKMLLSGARHWKLWPGDAAGPPVCMPMPAVGLCQKLTRQ